MLDLLLRTRRPFPTRSAFALAAVAGWSGFAYSALSSGQHVAALTVERDAAVANYQQLQEAAGDLKEVEAKLGAGQQELAALTRQLDETRDRASQTGSLRNEPSKPPKGKARKP
jgi:septal ring factor EnvC (AmiA/AmiB activator)